jgi:hypothetical protein
MTNVLGGMKKPLNQLSNPIFPDIKQGPPRFQWSRKHWVVDSGRTLMETEHVPQMADFAVLVQSRAYNSQNAYGVSSHRSAVNEEFRPPLIEPYLDNEPLSRQPVKAHAIIPRINPDTARSCGSTVFSAQNFHPSNIDKNISDRVKEGQWRPTFFAPLEMPLDNSVLPDLEMKLPSHSASAGFKYNTQDAPQAEIELRAKKIHPEDSAGFVHQYTTNGPCGCENTTLYYKDPQVSATAGVTSFFMKDGEIRTDYDFDYNRPQIAASAGVNPQYTHNADTLSPELEQKITPVYATANHDASHVYVDNLENAQSGMRVRDARPSYSYTVTPVFPYADENGRTAEVQTQRVYREKPSAQSRYHGDTNPGVVPRYGIERPRVRLREGVRINRGL